MEDEFQQGLFVSKFLWSEEHDHTLVILCSDPRLKQANDEFLRALGLKRYDRVAIPGGPAVILQSSLTFVNDRSRIKMLCEEHGITRVIAISHHNCAYYRRRYEYLPAQERLKKQEADLLLFVEEIKKLSPPVTVELYYAEVVGEQIRHIRHKTAKE